MTREIVTMLAMIVIYAFLTVFFRRCIDLFLAVNPVNLSTKETTAFSFFRTRVQCSPLRPHIRSFMFSNSSLKCSKYVLKFPCQNRLTFE